MGLLLTSEVQADLDDGLRKCDRQGRNDELVMFYDWINVDFGISRRDAERAVLDWAERQERDAGVSLVIVWNYNWRTPFYQTFAR